MVSAGLARELGFELLALSVDYGQRHRIELEAAAKTGRGERVAQLLGVVRGLARQVVAPGQPRS